MLAKVLSAAVIGLEGQLVEVEVDISGGLPSTTVVGTLYHQSNSIPFSFEVMKA